MMRSAVPLPPSCEATALAMIASGIVAVSALDEETVADHLPQSGGLAVQADLHREIIAS